MDAARSSDKVIRIPSNVTEIGTSAFQNAFRTGDAGFTLDLSQASNLTTIGASAFNKAKLSQTLVIPSSVKTIGASAFAYTKLTGLDLSNATSLTEIGTSAFQAAQLSGKLVIPSSVKTIGYSSFPATKLTELDLSNATSLTEIAAGAFYESPLAGNLVIPASVTNIAPSAFAKTNLTGVDLNNATSLTSIGYSAFEQTKLTSLDLSHATSLKSIGSSAFKGTQLSGKVTLPANVTTIGADVFANTSLSELDLSHVTNLKSIGGSSNIFEGAELSGKEMIPSTVAISGSRSRTKSIIVTPTDSIGVISRTSLASQDSGSSQGGDSENEEAQTSGGASQATAEPSSPTPPGSNPDLQLQSQGSSNGDGEAQALDAGTAPVDEQDEPLVGGEDTLTSSEDDGHQGGNSGYTITPPRSNSDRYREQPFIAPHGPHGTLVYVGQDDETSEHQPQDSSNGDGHQGGNDDDYTVIEPEPFLDLSTGEYAREEIITVRRRIPVSDRGQGEASEPQAQDSSNGDGESQTSGDVIIPGESGGENTEQSAANGGNSEGASIILENSGTLTLPRTSETNDEVATLPNTIQPSSGNTDPQGGNGGTATPTNTTQPTPGSGAPQRGTGDTRETTQTSPRATSQVGNNGASQPLSASAPVIQPLSSTPPAEASPRAISSQPATLRSSVAADERTPLPADTQQVSQEKPSHLAGEKEKATAQSKAKKTNQSLSPHAYLVPLVLLGAGGAVFFARRGRSESF